MKLPSVVLLSAAAGAVPSYASAALPNSADVLRPTDVDGLAVTRKLGEDCSPVDLSGGHDGVYFNSGLTNEGRPIYGTMDGGVWVLGYIGGGLDGDVGTRKLAADEHNDANQVSEGEDPLDHTWGKHKAALVSMGGGGGDGTDTLGLFKAAKQSMVGLDACTDGFWVHFELPQEGVTETFPIYVTPDCAVHPVDISTGWLRYDCVDCVPSRVDIDIGCTEAPAEVEVSCMNLGSDDTCEWKGDCCNDNELNTNVKCWDDRCCNRKGKMCEKDTHCCDGLTCTDGRCKKKSGCVSLGVSGCGKKSDCCSANENNKKAKCKQGRCCNTANRFCARESDCCPGYDCEGSKCVLAEESLDEDA